MRVKKDKLEAIYLYAAVFFIVLLLSSFAYLIYDDSFYIKQFVVYIILVCEVGVITVSVLLWRLNRGRHG